MSVRRGRGRARRQYDHNGAITAFPTSCVDHLCLCRRPCSTEDGARYVGDWGAVRLILRSCPPVDQPRIQVRPGVRQGVIIVVGEAQEDDIGGMRRSDRPVLRHAR